jgi:multidrug resistance efflux pump
MTTKPPIPDQQEPAPFLPAADYSPETSEIMERMPNRFLRQGLLAVFFVLLLLTTISVLVKYPDTLEGQMVLSSDPLPVQLKAPSGGRIVQLQVRDGAHINKGEVICEMENTTGYENIQRLQTIADSLLNALQHEDTHTLENLAQLNLPSLGEAQPLYNQLMQQVTAWLLLQQQHIYDKRMSSLHQQNQYYQQLNQIGRTESQLISHQLTEARERFEACQQLYADKVISRQEYLDETDRLRQKQLALQQQLRNSEQNALSISSNERQLMETGYERTTREQDLVVNIRNQVRNLQSFISDWQLKKLVIAPYAGKIGFLQPVQVNGQVNATEALFTIVPTTAHYTAYALLPAAGIGKIMKGQQVHLLLDHYPYNEFGYLQGAVQSLSSLPQPISNNGTNPPLYRISIQLPDSLVTTYHERIPFTAEMSGTARIITRDQSLLQRLVSGLARFNK